MIVEAPGIGEAKNSHANEPSLAGTMVAASFSPAVLVAKKLFALSVVGSTARVKKTCGRNVTPTSSEPFCGVTAVMPNGIGAARFTVRSSVVTCPAASVVCSFSVCEPALIFERSSVVLKSPVVGSNVSGMSGLASMR